MIREKQKKQIQEMITFDKQNTWKVLVMDQHTKNILSLLFKVNDLRDLGVTVHMMLHSIRETLRGVPALYFILPTKENLQRVLKDIQEDLYDTIQLFFIEEIDKQNLFFLSDECIKKNIPYQKIEHIYDTNLNFLSLEENLFSLSKSKTFVTLNNPTTYEEDVNKTIEDISKSLFSALSTLSVDKIAIGCKVKTAGELVAQKTFELLKKEILKQEKDIQNQTAHVYIFDRSFDVLTPLKHSFEYNALVNDLLLIETNTIKYKKENKNMFFDIEQTDWLWSSHSKSSLHETSIEISTQLTKYKEEEIRLTGGEENKSASEMKKAINELPELVEKKRVLSGHLNITETVLSILEERKLDTLFTIEKEITKCTENQLIEIIKDTSIGTKEDKIRLVLIYLLSNNIYQQTEKIENILKETKCDLRSINYIKRFLSLSKFSKQNNPQSLFSSFVSSVQTVIPTKPQLPCTKEIELFEKNNEDVLTFGNCSFKGKPNYVIVFIIGGITYSEYNDLDFSLSKKYKNVLIGSTEILNGNNFLSILEECS